VNITVDPDVVKTVQQDVNALKSDIDKMAFEGEMNRESVKKALHDCQEVLEELRERVAIVQHEQQVIKQGQTSLCAKMNTTQDQMTELKFAQEDVQQRVAYLGDDLSKHVATAVREQDMVKKEQEGIKQNQSSLCDKVNTTQAQISELKSEHEGVERRVTSLEDQQKSNKPQINHGNLNNFIEEQHEENEPQQQPVTKKINHSNQILLLLVPMRKTTFMQ